MLLTRLRFVLVFHDTSLVGPGHFRAGLLVLASVLTAICAQAAEPLTINLWPDKPPGEVAELPAEADQTKPDDKLIAGRRIIKLGNVSVPQITYFRPPTDKDTGCSVVICPGGGHHILAYDLEGTEVAEWLNGIGVTGVVLKYRVPFRDPDKRWRAAVQDGQRAMSLVRSRADEMKLDPGRIGILGFSAGGETAALVSILDQRQYDPVDDADQVSSRPDFAVLVYPGNLVEPDHGRLRDYIKVSATTPPMFLVHAFDDPVNARNSLLLAAELKRANVSAEVHLYARGGHGYGLRPVEGEPVTHWPAPCEAWMRVMQWIK
jgi:acetyl esterase/lipase